MNAKKLLPLIFILGFTITIISSILKIMHIANVNSLFSLGVMFCLAFIFMALYEIWNSTKIERHEKFMWSLGLVFTGGIVGFLYTFSRRKRIANI